MLETGPGIRECFRYKAVQLGRRVSPLDRRLAVGGRDERQERRDEDLKKSERKRSADQIEQDESPTGAPDIPYHLYQFGIGKMMGGMERKCYVGRRQRIMNNVRP